MRLRLPIPCLVVLIGPSGTGKSTWAEANFHPHEVISSDRLRAMVGAGEDDQTASSAAFDLLDAIVAERLRRGLTTVVDSLGFDQERRQRFVNQAQSAGISTHAVVFTAEPALAAERNTARAHPIPKRVLERQFRRLRQVEREVEGDHFDQVHRLDADSVGSPRPVALPDRARPGVTARFGLLLGRFQWLRPGDDWAGPLRAIARRAEQAGFRDLWLMDHLRQIPPVGRAWEPIPDPYVALSYLAAVTDRIRLGALVTPVTHRHPAILAKTIATLDVLSSGRANLGLGVGRDGAEQGEFGIDFPSLDERYERLADTVRVVRMMWGRGSPAYQGRTIRALQLACYPRPVQDHIPVTIGGSGPKRTLRAVALLGDACNLFGGPDQVGRGIAALRDHCDDVGRDPATVEVGHLLEMMVADDRRALRDRIEGLRPRNVTADGFATRHHAGTIVDQVERLTAYRAVGAAYTIVSMPDAHIEGSLEAFAEVAASLGPT